MRLDFLLFLFKFWCQIFQKHITSANKKSSQRPGQTSSHWKNRNECSILQYSSIYTHHCVQTILVKNAPWYLDPLIKIRTSNHKLPVQFYSWNIVFKPREERTCTICGSGEVGDELHYILHCEVFKDERNKFLPSTRNNKSLENFVNLLKSDKISILRGLAKFINIVFGVFE